MNLPNANIIRRSLFTSEFSLAESGLLYANEITGGPWCFTIVATTVAFRSCLIPVTIMQMKTINNISSGPAGFYTRNLTSIYQKQVKETDPKATRKHIQLAKTYIGGLGVIWKKLHVNPFKVIAVPIAQICFLVAYVVSVRHMISSGNIDLLNQGTLWFTDLGSKDSTMALPLVAVGTSYAALELSFGRSQQQSMGQGFREVFQTMLVFSVPFIVQLPAGVFMYWIPSSIFGITQSAALRTTFVRSIMDLKPPLQTKKKPNSV